MFQGRGQYRMRAEEIQARLLQVGYLHVKTFTDGHWAAVRHMLNGYAIARGDLTGIKPHHYFYKWEKDAQYALREWNGVGQPQQFVSTFNLAKIKGKAWDTPVRR